MEYTYSNGVPSRVDFFTPAGILAGYTTYDFANGRKLAAHRHEPTGAILEEATFSYDPISGRLTGSTSVDAVGTVTKTVTRTYVGNPWTQSVIDYTDGIRESEIPRFVYEDGPASIDVTIFAEF
jgi:hypothetical protein